VPDRAAIPVALAFHDRPKRDQIGDADHGIDVGVLLDQPDDGLAALACADRLGAERDDGAAAEPELADALEIAAPALLSLHRLVSGWSVPGRLSIAGFGNSEVSLACNPSITTIALDVTGMGLEIGRVLLDALSAGRGGRTLVPTTHMVDYEVVERESSGRL
jgi:hypothetical protein